MYSGRCDAVVAVADRIAPNFIARFSLLCALLIASVSHAVPADLQPLRFSQIQGWIQDDHAAALATFARSCARMIKVKRPLRAIDRAASIATMTSVCRRALDLDGNADRNAARIFFERNFVPYKSDAPGDRGLFTGYFEPQYHGSRTRTLAFHVPLYRRPHDFRQPYFERRQIEQGAIDGRDLELVFVASMVDAFFIHVQGSARIVLPDGEVMRVGFAAKSGHPYTAIGKVLIDRGALQREDVTMQSIRRWLEQNPAEAQDVMWRNRSFIFFREVATEDPALGPVGAQGVTLDALRSIAVDSTLYSYGLPVWLDTTLPAGKQGTAQPFRRLMVAQDTGSGVKGAVRADVFVGSGDAAGEIAGRMKQTGALFVLLPQDGGPGSMPRGDAAAPVPSKTGLK